MTRSLKGIPWKSVRLVTIAEDQITITGEKFRCSVEYRDEDLVMIMRLWLNDPAPDPLHDVLTPAVFELQRVGREPDVRFLRN